MDGERKTVRAVVGATALVLALAGCRGPEERSGGAVAAEGGTEALMREFWSAHGGAERWKVHAGVKFAYTIVVSGKEPGLSFPEVAFYLADYRYLWIGTRGGAKPVRVDLEEGPGGAIRALEESGMDPSLPGSAGEENPTRQILDLALRSIRYFLDLPLATSVGPWEFSSILAPPDVKVPPLIEVFPVQPSGPLGPCLLFLDATNSRLTDVIYVARLESSARAFRVHLRDYSELSGLPIAGERCHTFHRRGAGTKKDPFGLESPEDAVVARCEFMDRVGDVVFLGSREMAARYPRPEDEAPAGGKTQAGSQEGPAGPGAEMLEEPVEDGR